jgi:hypothetical protein
MTREPDRKDRLAQVDGNLHLFFNATRRDAATIGVAFAAGHNDERAHPRDPFHTVEMKDLWLSGHRSIPGEWTDQYAISRLGLDTSAYRAKGADDGLFGDPDAEP